MCAFDPTQTSKADKHTYGLDYWRCGTLQKAVRGLELGVLSMIDVAARSAFSRQATQTPSMQALREAWAAQSQRTIQKYAGKVDCKRIDKRYLRLFRHDQECSYYSGVAWATTLKRLVRVVYSQQDKSKDNVHRYSIPKWFANYKRSTLECASSWAQRRIWS